MYWSILLYGVMRWHFAKKWGQYPKRHIEQGKLFFNFPRKNKWPSRCSTTIISDLYTYSHGGMLLDIDISIVVLFISKGSSIFLFWRYVSYDTKKSPSCCLCFMCSAFLRFISYRQVPCGFCKNLIFKVIFYGRKVRQIELYYEEYGRYIIGVSVLNQFKLGLKLVGKHIK